MTLLVLIKSLKELRYHWIFSRITCNWNQLQLQSCLLNTGLNGLTKKKNPHLDRIPMDFIASSHIPGQDR